MSWVFLSILSACTMIAPVARDDRKKILLKLECQTSVSCHIGAGNESSALSSDEPSLLSHKQEDAGHKFKASLNYVTNYLQVKGTG